MKETKIKPNYIYEIEAMWLNAEEERIKSYIECLENETSCIKKYNWCCKRIAMINLDKLDISNYLMDYIKTLIEVNYIDNLCVRFSKFVISLSVEELLDRDLIKCFWVVVEEFELMKHESEFISEM